MGTQSGKKRRERTILDSIYNPADFQYISESERPDFALQRNERAQAFGVEVTEYYASQSSARLRNVPGYLGKILDGGRPLHKDDIHDLQPSEVKIWSEAGVSKGRAKMIITPHSPFIEHVDALVQRITEKEEKLKHYDPSLSHINLIIHDTEDRLVASEPENAIGSLFTNTMKQTLGATPFREIFYITKIGREPVRSVYVPLRQLFLVSELYLFSGAFHEFFEISGLRFGLEIPG